MKKIISAILALTLLLSSFASAGFLESLFGQASITGQQTIVEKNLMPQKPTVPAPIYGGFKGAVKKGTTFKHDVMASLPNDVMAKSVYNAKDKSAKITFSKTFSVSNNHMLRFDDGSYTVTSKNNPLLPSGIVIQRKGKGIVSGRSEPMSLAMKNMFGDKVFLAFGKPVQMANGFSATAEKSGTGMRVVVSKTVVLRDNQEIALVDEKLGVTVNEAGVTFHPMHSPTAFKSEKPVTGSGFVVAETLVTAQAEQPAQESTITGAKTATATAAKKKESNLKSDGLISETIKSLSCKNAFTTGKIMMYAKPVEQKNGFTTTTSYDTAKKKASITFTKTLTFVDGQQIKTDDGIFTAVVSDKGLLFVRGNVKPLPKKKADGTICTANEQCLSNNCGYDLPDNAVANLGLPKKCIPAKKEDGKICTADRQCISNNCGYDLPDNAVANLGLPKKCIAKVENAPVQPPTDLLISI